MTEKLLKLKILVNLQRWLIEDVLAANWSKMFVEGGASKIVGFVKEISVTLQEVTVCRYHLEQ
jgi:hypothetical protein